MQTMRNVMWTICLTTGLVIGWGSFAGCDSGSAERKNADNADGDSGNKPGSDVPIKDASDSNTDPPKETPPAAPEIPVDAPEET